jgi:hypothetical protein
MIITVSTNRIFNFIFKTVGFYFYFKNLSELAMDHPKKPQK